MSKKNEVFRFLLETAGSADEIDLGTGSNQDNITKALMSSMVQGNQFAEFNANQSAQKLLDKQRKQEMKNLREQEIRDMQTPSNPVIKSTK